MIPLAASVSLSSISHYITLRAVEMFNYQILPLDSTRQGFDSLLPKAKRHYGGHICLMFLI